MVMDQFDLEDDLARRKYKAATRRVLVVGVVCVTFGVLMVAVVLAVLLTAERDTRQQVDTAPIQGGVLSSQLDQTSMTTPESLGTEGPTGTMSTVTTQTVQISEYPVVMTTTPNPVVMTTTPNPVVVTTTPNPVVMTTTQNPVVMTTTPNPFVMTTPQNPVVMITTQIPVVMTTTQNPVAMTTTRNPVAMTTTHDYYMTSQNPSTVIMSSPGSSLSSTHTIDISPTIFSSTPFISMSLYPSDVMSGSLVQSVESSLYSPVLSSRSLYPTIEHSMTLDQFTVSSRSLYPTIESSRSLDPSIVSSRSLYPTVESSRSLDPSIVSSRSLYPTVERSRSLYPSIVSSRSLYPTVESSRSLDPSIVSSRSLYPTVERSRSLYPSIVSSRSPYPTVESSRSLDPSFISSRSLYPTVESSRSLYPTVESSRSLDPLIASSRSLYPSVISPLITMDTSPKYFSLSTDFYLPTVSSLISSELLSDKDDVYSSVHTSPVRSDLWASFLNSEVESFKDASSTFIGPGTHVIATMSEFSSPTHQAVSTSTPPPSVSTILSSMTLTPTSPIPVLDSLTFDIVTTIPDTQGTDHLLPSSVPTLTPSSLSWSQMETVHSTTFHDLSTSPRYPTEMTSSVAGVSMETVTITTGTPTSSSCPPGEASCGDGTCLTAAKFCDGNADCPDVSDEGTHCTGCASGQFRCASGQCVSSLARCDKYPQCLDKTDEHNCSGCLGFQCTSGLCLWTHSARCDTVVDCDDLSDELGCGFRPGYRRCNNGMFILGSDWCNGVDDCYDNSDETQCACEPQTEVACADGGCIRREWLCDGNRDCRNGTDEEMCDSCNSTDFVCPDYSCVPMVTVCDGQENCPGGGDENNCFTLVAGDNLTSGHLWVQHTDLVQPLCSSHWTLDLSDVICSYLGHKKSVRTVYTPDDSRSASGSYFELRSEVITSATSDILNNVVNVTSCTNDSIISISCTPTECGQRSDAMLTPYIAGGQLPPLGKWPWVVSLTYLGEPLCAAVIVTSQWLVTAGHCVALQGYHDYTETPFYVRALAGSIRRDLDPQSQVVVADRLVQHPNFTWTGLGPILWDLALVHLQRPLTFTEVIQPICLPNGDGYHGNCYLAGWGYMDDDGGQQPQYLREVKVQVWSDADCQQDTVPMETHVNTNITLCAGYSGGILSGCQGDSGGPLMCENTRGRWFLAGVLSSGSANCGVVPTRADRFTRVSALQEWISDVIGIS